MGGHERTPARHYALLVRHRTKMLRVVILGALFLITVIEIKTLHKSTMRPRQAISDRSVRRGKGTNETAQISLEVGLVMRMCAKSAVGREDVGQIN